VNKRELLSRWVSEQGPLWNSKEDEPVFIIVARDKASTAALQAWADKAREIGASAEKVDSALEVANAMDVWRAANGGGKVPD
jgi:hypothetical protein